MQETNDEFWSCIDSLSQGNEVLEEMNIDYDNDPKFKQSGTLFYHFPDVKYHPYIAAFDMDWTLTYSEQKLFPKDPDDIKIIPKRKEYLEKCFKSGYTLVLFTNQHTKSMKEKLKRVERVKTFLRLLGLPMIAIIATEKDQYRKPDIGMWQKLKHRIPTVKYGFYCGDAAGNLGDFSDSDKEFALNIKNTGENLTFYEPEELFSPTEIPSFNTHDKQMIILVGMPGSGKTKFYEENFEPNGYIHINQDIQKTKANVLRIIKDTIQKGKSLVIDATNPSQEKREEYYALAKGYKITVFYFIRDGRKGNEVRAESGGRKVPIISYHIYFKNLDPPTSENTPGNVFRIT